MQRFGALGLFAFFAIALVIGCGGGGSGSSTIPKGGGNSPTLQQSSITIFIPQPSTASVARSPQYVSASTKSVVITLTSVNGVPPSPAIPPTVFNTTVPPCTAVTGGIACDVTVGAVLGNDVFTIVAYDGTNGTGNVLSSGSVSVAVGPGTNTPPPVALGGAVAKVVVTLPSNASQLLNGDLSPSIDGTVTSIQVTVNAYDAGKNLIIGSAPYASPIPITVSGDPNGAFTVSPTSVIAPNQNVITLGTSGKPFYPTPSPVNPNPTLTTASITFGPSGANGTTYVVDPIQFDLPSGGLMSILPAPSLTTIGLQQAGVNSFGINASFSSTPTSNALAVVCGSTISTGATPSPLPLNCSATGGTTEFTMMSSAGGSGSIQVTASGGGSGNLPFNALASQGGGATLGYSVVLWSMPQNISFSNQDVPTSMALGPRGLHLWVAATNATTGGAVTAIPSPAPSSCSTSPCALTGAVRITLPAVPSTTSYLPIPKGLVIGGDGNLWYEDLGTNALSSQTVVDISASQCLSAGSTSSCAIAYANGSGPSTTGETLSSSSESLADGGDGNIYMLFDNNASGVGAAVSAAPYLGSISTTIATPEPLTSLVPSIAKPVAEGIVRGPNAAMWMTVDDPNATASAIVEFSNCVSGSTFSCPSGSSTTFSETTASGPYHPGEIVSVPTAQQLWFIDHGSGSTSVAPFIESVASGTGAFGPRITIPNVLAVSGTIALGPDGNLWFPVSTTTGAQQICRYTIVASASGASFYCVTIPPVSGTSYPAGPMATGPDGNLWFGLVGAPYVGEVLP